MTPETAAGGVDLGAAVEAGADALDARNPSDPHGNLWAARIAVHAAAPHILRAAVEHIAAQFPADVWPDDSASPDARAAVGVRHACKLFRDLADEIGQQ